MSNLSAVLTTIEEAKARIIAELDIPSLIDLLERCEGFVETEGGEDLDLLTEVRRAIERLRNGAAPADEYRRGVEDALLVAQRPRNISMTGGSTGDAYGTARRIIEGIRALLPTKPEEE